MLIQHTNTHNCVKICPLSTSAGSTNFVATIVKTIVVFLDWDPCFTFQTLMRVTKCGLCSLRLFFKQTKQALYLKALQPRLNRCALNLNTVLSLDYLFDLGPESEAKQFLHDRCVLIIYILYGDTAWIRNAKQRKQCSFLRSPSAKVICKDFQKWLGTQQSNWLYPNFIILQQLFYYNPILCGAEPEQAITTYQASSIFSAHIA